MAKVLVACEESQIVCKAFRDKGHEAYSCDLEDCSGGHPEWHFKQNVLPLLNRSWDLVIAHPPCTYLTNAGVMHLHSVKSKNGVLPKIHGEERWALMEKACEFFNAFKNCAPKVCIENPIPHKYAREKIGKYTQVVQPWMFGHMETKATCLWLENLPKLTPTNDVKEEMMLLPKKERQRIHYIGNKKDRAKIRSKTFQGLATALADQYG